MNKKFVKLDINSRATISTRKNGEQVSSEYYETNPLEFSNYPSKQEVTDFYNDFIETIPFGEMNFLYTIIVDEKGIRVEKSAI